MLGRIARFTVRRRRWVLGASLAFLLLAGALGGSVAQHLGTGGFQDANAESSSAERLLNTYFHTGEPNFVLLVTAKSGSVSDAGIAATGSALTKRLASQPDVQQALSYWSVGEPPPLASADKSQALILARLTSSKNIEDLAKKFTIDNRALTVSVGGQAQIFSQVGTQIEHDLAKAETITFPIVMILLVLVFGSVVAAGLPLGVGGLAIMGAFLVLRGLAAVTHVSIFSLNLATSMGLGLGIDYSLFIVSRFREELRAGRGVEDAIVRTVETAGKTIVFSGATVAISLAALLVFPLYFLRSFAYAGAAVVAIAVAGAVLFLPALLAVLGTRVDKWTLWHRQPKEVGEGFWHRLATFVMGRPVVVGVTVIVILLVLGAPFLGVHFGLPDDRVLPPSASSRQVQNDIRNNFSSEEAAPLSVVALGVANPAANGAAIDAYARRLSTVAGVARVDALTGSFIGGRRVAPQSAASARFAGVHATWFSVVPSVEPMSAAGEKLVHEVRSMHGPFDVVVGGPSASLVDSKASIFSKIPLAGGIITAVTLLVLFMMTGSLLVPIKAIVLNLLSLTATFGAMVFIFQEGHFASFLNFTPTGFLDTTTPILMFCVAFGLSMDYEVFLLSRIKEEHDHTGDNVASVAVGLERTGRIVTAAAALLAVVFLAIGTSGITFIKMMGIGLSLAVLMDATLIRGALVPAFMRLAGNANWWAPKPLRRFHDRFGFSDAEAAPLATGPTTPEVAGSRP